MSEEKPGDLHELADKLAAPSEAEQAAMAADDEHRAHLTRLQSERALQFLAHLAAMKPE